MDRRLIWLFMIVWHIMMSNWVMCARNINMHGGLLHQQGQLLQFSKSHVVTQEGIGRRGKEEEVEVLSRVGSRPPRCEHKCRGCAPCSPTQVPTVHFGPQYTNYEPEGWKCQCASVFYNP